MEATKTKFERATDTFKVDAKLEMAELTNIANTGLRDCLQAIDSIQKKQATDRKLMYMKRLDPFIRAVQGYEKSLEGVLRASDFISFIWGPMKYVLLAASTHPEALNSLLNAYQMIGEQIPQFPLHQELFSSNPNVGDYLLLVYEDILEFHQAALKYFKRRMWTRLFHATWSGFSGKMTALRTQMQQNRYLIETWATGVEIEKERGARDLETAEVRKTKEASTARQRSRMLEWLSPASSDMFQESCVKARSEYPTAGQWLLSDERFQQWFRPDFCSHPLIWLNGIPGAGKTVLASLVVEEARKLPDTTVVFFYFQFGDESRDSFLSVARGILSQLLSQEISDDSLLLYVENEASKSGDAVLASLKLAKQLLDTALRYFKKTYIILDGIDECSSRDERKEISTWFRQLIDGLPREEMDAIRCMFVSQDDGIARKDLSMLPSIRLLQKSSTSDIREFASVWQQRIEKRHDTRCDIADLVAGNSQGIFLYAKLVLSNLYEQPSSHALREEIASSRFPRNLEEAYERILDRIINSNSKKVGQAAAKLLGWIAYAKRPLKWHELQGAHIIDIDSRTMSTKNWMLRDDWQEICGHLAEIRSDDSVRFLHRTTREYLLRSRHIDSSCVEYGLAVLCISYLTFPGISLKTQSSEVEDNILQGYFSFYEYAVVFWVSHLENVLSGDTTTKSIDQLAVRIEKFLEVHAKNSLSQNTPVASKTLRQKLQALKGYSWYDRLTHAIISSRKQLSRYTRSTPEIDVLKTSSITTRFRSLLENLAAQSIFSGVLTDYYGPNWYKCSKLGCQYFYKGFNCKERRDRHVERHERPFFCISEECSPLGSRYYSLKELEEHLFDFHGIGFPSDLEFPESPTAKKTPLHPLKFKCDLCSKSFTRSLNLQSHMRSHKNEKPFICTECDTAFSRQNDLNRHSKLHSGEKSYVCEGFLESGEKWGCGRKFSRPDKLREHHKSTRRTKCRKVLLEEKETLKRNLPQDDKKSRSTEVGLDHNMAREPLALEETFNLSPAVTSPLLPMDLAGHMEGEKNLQQNQHREDNSIMKTTKKWICIEPADHIRRAKPEVPISKCQTCSAKSIFSSSYNAATHLRRMHFKPRKGRKLGPSNEKTGGGGDWPPMSELKHWIKEIDDPSYDRDFLAHGGILESDAMSSLWRSEPDVIMDPMPGFLLDFSQPEFLQSVESEPTDFLDFLHTIQEGESGNTSSFIGGRGP